MSAPTFSQVSRQEIASMQEDALRRVREMQKRAQRATQEANRLQLGPQDFPYNPPPTLGQALARQYPAASDSAATQPQQVQPPILSASPQAQPPIPSSPADTSQPDHAPADASSAPAADSPATSQPQHLFGAPPFGGTHPGSGPAYRPPWPPYRGGGAFPRFQPGPLPGSPGRNGLLGALFPHWGGRPAAQAAQPAGQPDSQPMPPPAAGSQSSPAGQSGALGSLFSLLSASKGESSANLGETIASAISSVSTPAHKILDALGLDSERILILMVLLVLLNEKADKTLLLALGYLLLSN